MYLGNDFIGFGFVFDEFPVRAEKLKGTRKLNEKAPARKAPEKVSEKKENLIPLVENDIDGVYENRAKRTFIVKWKNGDVTKLTCSKEDRWDTEKALSIAIIKHYLSADTGAFNELFKKYCK